MDLKVKSLLRDPDAIAALVAVLAYVLLPEALRGQIVARLDDPLPALLLTVALGGRYAVRHSATRGTAAIRVERLNLLRDGIAAPRTVVNVNEPAGVTRVEGATSSTTATPARIVMTNPPAEEGLSMPYGEEVDYAATADETVGED